MPIPLNAHVALSSEVLLQEIGEESVLLDLKSESYFGLNAVGTRVWRLLEQDGAMANVRAAVLAEYDVPTARLDQDLSDLLASLAEAGLITVDIAHASPA